MRLWHYQLLRGLPRQQLVSQLRECTAIALDIRNLGKPSNNYLINKINDYPFDEFKIYCNLVVKEMTRRGYVVKNSTLDKIYECLSKKTSPCVDNKKPIFKNWHDYAYMDICFYNLMEKYLCGNITEKEWLDFKEVYFERRTLLNERTERQTRGQNEEIRSSGNTKVSSTWVAHSCKD